MRSLLLAALAVLPTVTLAHWNGDRPDGHAPISVMGDHTHAKGEWMLAYRYMGMRMDGQLAGSRDISDKDALALVPGMGPMAMKAVGTEMTTHMHMVGGMVAISDTVTLAAGLPYITREMTSLSESTMMGTPSYREAEMNTSGVGDLSVTALVKAYDSTHFRVLWNLGVGFPTGSITEEDYMANAGQDMQLPYGMQLGSGSYEFRPGLTFLGQQPDWSWGIQAKAAFALNDNDQGYRLGRRNELSGWLARVVSDSVSVSVLARYQMNHDIVGEAEDLMISPAMNPAADPDGRQRERVVAGLGVNWLARQGSLKGHRLALEILAPVYERVDEPQLGLEHAIVLGWQKAYGH